MAKKEKSKGIWYVLIGIVILAAVAFVLSISTVGCNYYENYVDEQIKPLIEEAENTDETDDYTTSETFHNLVQEKFGDGALPGTMWKVAQTHKTMGRQYLAAKSYRKFLDYFGSLQDNEKIAEAEYKELHSMYESAQYKTSGELISDYLDKHSEEPVDPWFEKAQKMQVKWEAMGASKKAMDDPTRQN